MAYDPSDPLRNSGGNNLTQGPSRVFYTVVVADFISNPTALPAHFLRSMRGRGFAKGVVNSDFVTRMPRNSILGYKVSDGSGELDQLEIFYPFFSPHLCLPVKPGEQVWVMYETVGGGETLGYWMTRKCVDLQVDDINYTHADRMNVYRDRRGRQETLKASILAEGDPDTNTISISMPSFPNGDPSSPDGRTLKQIDAYSRILKNSTAMGKGGSRNQFIGESVPRISKAVGDLVLQGSNNSSIILGTEPDPVGVITNSSFPRSMPDTGQGAIDICTGRGQTTVTATAFSAEGVENSRGYNESSKLPKQEILLGRENTAEGAPDFLNDLSRIYLSMKTNADENFSIGIEGIDKSEGGKPAIVLRTSQLRLVATEDLKIVVGDETSGAAVVLKADGNIVFVPGPTGLIKLGGEDADKAILTTSPKFTTDAGMGGVTTTPVMTTAGGSLAFPEETAEGSAVHISTFASKILVK